MNIVIFKIIKKVMLFSMLHTREYDYPTTFDWLITVIYHCFESDLMEFISKYDVNHRCGVYPGYTPLELAIYYNRPDMVKKLIKNGADLNTGLDYIVNNYWTTKNYLYHAKILLENGAFVTSGHIIDATGELKQLLAGFQKIDPYDDHIFDEEDYNGILTYPN